jgi:CRP-like cAMP-binding protein
MTSGVTTPTIEERAKLVRASFLFNELEPRLISEIAATSRLRALDKGAILFQQGDPGDALFIVVEGLVRIAVMSQAGKELTLGFMEPGDVFGEIALLDGLPRTASAAAALRSVLLTIERRTFLDLIAREARLAQHVIELLCERLRFDVDRVAEDAFLNLKARLAKRLDALGIAHGRTIEGGIKIDLRLSQSELAQMLGVSREAVNKQLKAWGAEGLLRWERGYITLLDRNRLVDLYRQGEG